MAAIRSSVRPTTTKQPWGTIIKPEFGMGHQKMNDYEIEQTVARLYTIPTPRERVYLRPGKSMAPDEINEMLQRLTTVDKEKIPDHDRRVTSSSYKQMGILCSYAWRGYN